MKLIIEWNGRKFGIENNSLNFDNNYMYPFLTRKPSSAGINSGQNVLL